MPEASSEGLFGHLGGRVRRISPRQRAAAALIGVATLAAAIIIPARAAGPTMSPATTTTPVVGIHDSSVNACDNFESNITAPHYTAAAAAMNDPGWAALHIHTVRFSPPWDIANPVQVYLPRIEAAQAAHNSRRVAELGNALRSVYVEQLCMNYWLASVAAHHLAPEIVFKPDHNYLDESGKMLAVPDIRGYKAAIQAFVNTYSNCNTPCRLPAVYQGWPSYPAGTGGMAAVKIVSPWGEPDFASSSPVGFSKKPQILAMPRGGSTFDDPHCAGPETDLTCGPVLAAHMWVAVQHRCNGCSVIAGDFSSGGGFSTKGGPRSYLHTYAGHLDGERPETWGLHPYTDISNFEFDTQTHRHLPKLSDTLTGRFAAALHSLGYRERTRIVLNEISAFQQRDMYGHCAERHLPQDCAPLAYSAKLQGEAVKYLITELVRAGGHSVDGQPAVTGMYYLRYSDGRGFPYWALVVGGQRQPAYSSIEHRPSPQR